MTTPLRQAPDLDARLAEVAAAPGRTWGLPDAVLGLAALPVTVLLAGLLLLPFDLGGPVTTTLASLLLVGVAALAARRPARQSGGLRRALGLDAPRAADTSRVLLWTLVSFVAPAAAVLLLGLLVPALAGAPADNVAALRGLAGLDLLLVAVSAVLLAPVVEELLFRGLVLQGLMMHTDFWPAAAVSSAAFGLLHAPSATAGALPVVVGTGVIGLALCVLARRTGRLGPGIAVHALHNAVAVALVTAA